MLLQWQLYVISFRSTRQEVVPMTSDLGGNPWCDVITPLMVLGGWESCSYLEVRGWLGWDRAWRYLAWTSIG